MDHPSVRRQRLWEAMESCRNGSDDPSDPQFADLAARLAEDPELREQFQHLQEADGAIRAAFADVPVPAGLADRVLQRLAEAAPGKAGGWEQGAGSSESAPAASDCLAAATVKAPAVAASEPPSPLRTATERFSRRRLLVGFTALSAAAALLAAVWIETHPSRHETPDSVLDEAMNFFDNDNQLVGEIVSAVAPPANFPGRDIAWSPDVRWRHVEKFLDGPAVAYDLPTHGGRATLYVVERNVPGLPSMAPDWPKSNTGGKSAAAWQAGNTIYILVVEGDAGMYRSYLNPHGPMA